MTDEQDVICPFCDEGGFDLPGLAGHIHQHCDAADAALEKQAADLRAFYESMARKRSTPNEGAAS